MRRTAALAMPALAGAACALFAAAPAHSGLLAPAPSTAIPEGRYAATTARTINGVERPVTLTINVRRERGRLVGAFTYRGVRCEGTMRQVAVSKSGDVVMDERARSTNAQCDGPGSARLRLRPNGTVRYRFTSATGDPWPAINLLPVPSAPRATMRQLAGQRIGWALDGKAVTPELDAAIRAGEVGTVILFRRNIASPDALAALVAQMQAIPRPAAVDVPLLITIDQEGGAVKRLPTLPPTMSPADMGATLDTAGIRAQGRATADALRPLGVTGDYAPVCDVPGPGSIIAQYHRAFGSSADQVGERCTAFAQGLADGGVAASAKHFPGFGLAAVNTDDAPVTLDITRDQVNQQMAPFRQAIRGGVGMVMLDTAIYPVLSPLPAALSSRIAGGLLRGPAAFRGVSVTDALDTPTLHAWGGNADVARAVARAGTDIALFCFTWRAGQQGMGGVLSALTDGSITRGEAEASLARTLALRRQVAAGGPIAAPIGS